MTRKLMPQSAVTGFETAALNAMPIAAAVLVFPIAVATAGELNVALEPFAITLMVAASASFATPIGYQTNTLVYGAGNYRFADFLRIGVPMNIIVGLASITAIWFIFPM